MAAIAELVENIVDKNNQKCKKLEETIEELQQQITSFEETIKKQVEDFLGKESASEKKYQELQYQLIDAEIKTSNLESSLKTAKKENEAKTKKQKSQITSLQKKYDEEKLENSNQLMTIQQLKNELNETEVTKQKLDEENSNQSKLLEKLKEENREKCNQLEAKMAEMQKAKELLKSRLDEQTQLSEVSNKSRDDERRMLEEKIEALEKKNENLQLEEDLTQMKFDEVQQQLTTLMSENQKLKDEAVKQGQLMEFLVASSNEKCNNLSNDLEKLQKEKAEIEGYDESCEIATLSVIPEESFNSTATMQANKRWSFKAPMPVVQPETQATKAVQEAAVLEKSLTEHEQSTAVDTFKADIYRQIKNFHLRIDTNDWSNKPIVLQKAPYIDGQDKVGRRIAMVCPVCNKKILISRRIQIEADNTQHEVNDIRSYKRHVKTLHKFDTLDKTNFK
jgi:myosin heavy subunit